MCVNQDLRRKSRERLTSFSNVINSKKKEQRPSRENLPNKNNDITNVFVNEETGENYEMCKLQPRRATVQFQDQCLKIANEWENNESNLIKIKSDSNHELSSSSSSSSSLLDEIVQLKID
jgi:hypothetical protein